MPEPPVIVDTGPLVSFLDNQDSFHDWSVEQFRELPSPFVTCETVMAETFHLLKRIHSGLRIYGGLLQAPWLSVSFDFERERRTVERLLRKYEDLPVSLADACLVRMAEVMDDARVLTVDSQFRIYRKHGRREIPVILPPGR